MQDPLHKDPTGIQMSFDWTQVPTDGSRCTECEMVIRSEKMWQMMAFVNYELIETRFKMCEACYAIKNPEGLPDESGRET